MHIIIGFITALASLLYALERLGVDVGWVNPWAWKRKRKWLKRYHANPAFSLTSPLETVALLLTAVAKIDGDMSSDEKSELLTIFSDELKQGNEESSSLLSSSVFLLSKNDDVYANPEKVLEVSHASFTDAQKKSTLALLKRMANMGGSATPVQLRFIDSVSAKFQANEPKSEAWS